MSYFIVGTVPVILKNRHDQLIFYVNILLSTGPLFITCDIRAS